ncbi:uncharacterized protein LOC112510547 [Cynara cardunculus var. scolymus]|uniref:Uncharacterized protein family UPF0114 n=1 Tax=Cynara cardunculus var. scolymus TaxID=59895 RepID=A0A118K3W8_CYNCS|nr:uncharacterized protein LOC112510547 [Cynara cardunculus var. scolymus]KVI06600.1 Uncharacterized protein family UPF0114 [Cynara cardunculus var. scolymus]
MAAVILIRTSILPSALGAPAKMIKPRAIKFTCMSAGFGPRKDQLIGDVERKSVAVTKVAAISMVAATAPPQTREKVDLATLMVLVRTTILRKLKVVKRRRPWSSVIQSLVEKVIMDSRFFAMIGVAGTLLGSVLCFLEGVFLVLESYLQYFYALSRHSDHSHIMHLLIEALDMFLVGTAMLTFGIGLHFMFIGSRATKGNGSPLPSSNLFGLFYLKEFPTWAGMKSISEAKSKIGHALMLLLQVGILEKFKSVPLVTGLDLACFAASVFVSSAGLFILSKLSMGTKT